MIFEKYDWCKDRVAFFEIDQMRENLWNELGAKSLMINFTYRDLNIDRAKDSINNSVWNKLKNG